MARDGRSRSPTGGGGGGGAERKVEKKVERKRVHISAGPATPTTVIDTLAYVMPPFDGANGANIQRLQAEVGLNPTFTMQIEPEPRRFVDGSALLLNPETRVVREAVTWSRDDFSRLTWHVDGKRYLKGYLPAHVAVNGGAYSTENLVAAMDVTDVTLSILNHPPACGDVTPLHREAYRRFPHRFRRLVTLPNLSAIPSDVQASIATIEAELAFGGVVGFQFFTGAFEGDWSSPEMAPFWDYLQRRKLPVWFTIMAMNTRTVTSVEEVFKADFEKILSWCGKYTETDAIITHGLPWRSYVWQDRKGIGPLPKWALKVGDYPRLYLQLSLPACIGEIFDFPYKEVNTMIERLAKRIGANHLLFGSEMPSLERFCTYSQSVKQIFAHFDFMTLEERALVLGGNARRLIAEVDQAITPQQQALSRVPPCWKELHFPLQVPALQGQSLATVQTPCLVVDMDLFELNCQRAAEKVKGAAEAGLVLRPRMEAHKCPELARKQIAALGGLANGIACQTLRQAEIAVRGRVSDVMITSLLADEQKVQRVVALASAGASVTVCVDSNKSLGLLKQAATAARAPTIDVMLDLGVAQRAGAPMMSLDTAVAMAHTVEAASALRLRGLQVYLPPDPTARESLLATVHSYIGALRQAGINTKLAVSSEDIERWTLTGMNGVYQEIQCGSSVFQGAELAPRIAAPLAQGGSGTNGSAKPVPSRPPRVTITCKIDCPELGMSWNVVSQSQHKTPKAAAEQAATATQAHATNSTAAPTASAAAPDKTATKPAAEAEGGSSMDEDSDDDDSDMEAKAEGGAGENGAVAGDATADLKGPSLFVVGTVLGAASASSCVVDVGSKALALDCGKITILCPIESGELKYTSLGDNYGSVLIDGVQACPESGSRLQHYPEHCDGTASLYDFVVAVRKGVVEGVYSIGGRGH